MKAHIGSVASSGLVHSLRVATGHVSDIAEGNVLLHWFGEVAFGDTGYQVVVKSADTRSKAPWRIAMRQGKPRALDKNDQTDGLIDQAEKLQASGRVRVGHPFRVIKRQFEYVRMRYRGLEKNTVQLFTLLALSNLCVFRDKLMTAQE